jgi:hypothetical protein
VGAAWAEAVTAAADSSVPTAVVTKDIREMRTTFLSA